VETSSKAVLVTGCDTGFGFALAQHLHELGFFVFAGCLMKDKGGDGVKKLDAEGKSTGRLVTVQLDVTNDAQVKAAVQTVKDTLPSNIKVSPGIISIILVLPTCVTPCSIGSVGCRKQCGILDLW
jgi:3-hydroxybutyrate dehydrogenase